MSPKTIQRSKVRAQMLFSLLLPLFLAMILVFMFLFLFSSCSHDALTTSSEPEADTDTDSDTDDADDDIDDDDADDDDDDIDDTDAKDDEGKKEYLSMTQTDLAREAGEAGMVLLKNEGGALPITHERRAALIGEAQINFIEGVNELGAVYGESALEALQNKEKEGKISLFAPFAARYSASAKYSPSQSDLDGAAKEADTAIVILSRRAAENGDLTRAQYEISSSEKALFERIKQAGFAHTVVVLNIPSIIDSTYLRDESGADAILICWQGGSEGANALADVLVGDVSPSGKLTDTMASSYDDYPASAAFALDAYATYSEDIFVGYRYFETFDPDYEKVNYEFGFGLSYTEFDIKVNRVSKKKDRISAKVTVTNIGKTSGKEVVQMYYSCPQGKVKLGKAGKELAAFAKTSLLEAGQSETFTLSFAINDMASYDDVGKIQKSAYVLEAGSYDVYIGNSIRNASERGAVYTYNPESDAIVSELNEYLRPVELAERLSADGKKEKLTTGNYGYELAGSKTYIPATDYLIQYTCADPVSSETGEVYGMELTAGDVLYFAVRTAKSGEYKLSLALGFDGNNKSYENVFSISSNGKRYNVTLKPSGGKFKIKEQTAVVLSLSKGTNIIAVSCDKSDPSSVLLSYLLFTGSAKGKSDLRTVVPQSYIPTDSDILFEDVCRDNTKMGEFIDSLTIEEMLDLLCDHSPKAPLAGGSLGYDAEKGVPYLQISADRSGFSLPGEECAWPSVICAASSWDTDLLYAIGVKTGDECLSAGVDIWLSPYLNIHRDPLGGRNSDSFSEDPYFTGKMAASLIEGVQSGGKVGVMIKSLFAAGRQVGEVDGDSRISERAAREIYLRAFEIALKEAHPWAIMTSCNSCSRIFNSENGELLDGIVRSEWGFEGLICTDPDSHSAQFREIAAGADAEIGRGNSDTLYEAWRAGLITTEQIKASAGRVLAAILKSASAERLIADTE